MTREANKRTLLAHAAKLGVTINERVEGDSFTIYADAPERHWFPVDGIHEMVVSGSDDLGARNALRGEMVYRLSFATVEPCPNADCEWCSGE